MKAKSLQKLFSILIVLAILLSSCAPASTPTPQPAISLLSPFGIPTPEPFIPIEVSLNQAVTMVERNTLPNTPSDDFKTLVNGNNRFAADLYQVVRSTDGNFMFSPYSISLALAMTYAGARGETATQMAETLHFDLPPARFHTAFNTLDLALQSREMTDFDGNTYHQFNSVNSIWVEQALPLEQGYVDLVTSQYGVSVYLENFANQPESARQNINKWVYNATQGRIGEMFSSGSIQPDTRMILANTSYFNATWRSQFESDKTSEASFYLLNGEEVIVKMMHQPIYQNYYLDAGVQAVEFPYSGGATTIFILPDKGNFEAFEASFSSTTLDRIFAHFEKFPVNLSLPRFTFESAFNLSDALKSMGMLDAFSLSADFSGITPKDILIKEINHRTSIFLNEEGTEAVATTAVIMIEVSARHTHEVDFTIDRPFIFVIRDQNHQILFIGRVLDPSK